MSTIGYTAARSALTRLERRHGEAIAARARVAAATRRIENEGPSAPAMAEADAAGAVAAAAEQELVAAFVHYGRAVGIISEPADIGGIVRRLGDAGGPNV